MSDTAQQVVFGLVAPLVIALLLIAPLTRRCKPEGARDRFAWRLPLGLAGAVVLAFLAMYGRPTEQWQHVTYVGVVGAVVGVLLSATPRRVWIRGLLLVVLAVGATAVLWPVIEAESWPRRLWPLLGTIVLALAIEPLAWRRPGVSLPLALGLAVGGSAAVVLISGFMKLTVPFAALGFALAACGAIAFWRCDFSLADGAIAVIAPMLVAAPFVAWLYMDSAGGDLPMASFVLPSAAPLLLWAGEVPLVRKRGPWLAVGVRLAIVVAVCLLAIALAMGWGAEEAESEDPMEQMYREMMGGATEDTSAWRLAGAGCLSCATGGVGRSAILGPGRGEETDGA